VALLAGELAGDDGVNLGIELGKGGGVEGHGSREQGGGGREKTIFAARVS
jgi:hypothetical protein